MTHDEQIKEVAKVLPDLSIKEKVKFLEKIKINKSGCWQWLGDGARYGRVCSKKQRYLAHRISYEVFYSKKIKKGMVIDHLCKNTKCVNPSHLEEVTPNENLVRGNFFSILNRKKTHCPKGHKYAGENLYMINGKKGKERKCRICKNNQVAEYRKRLASVEKLSYQH